MCTQPAMHFRVLICWIWPFEPEPLGTLEKPSLPLEWKRNSNKLFISFLIISKWNGIIKRYALSPSRMQLQLRTAIQSSGNKKASEKGAAEGKKCAKKRRKENREWDVGRTGKRTIDIYTRSHKASAAIGAKEKRRKRRIRQNRKFTYTRAHTPTDTHTRNWRIRKERKFALLSFAFWHFIFKTQIPVRAPLALPHTHFQASLTFSQRSPTLRLSLSPLSKLDSFIFFLFVFSPCKWECKQMAKAAALNRNEMELWYHMH